MNNFLFPITQNWNASLLCVIVIILYQIKLVIPYLFLLTVCSNLNETQFVPHNTCRWKSSGRVKTQLFLLIDQAGFLFARVFPFY